MTKRKVVTRIAAAWDRWRSCKYCRARFRPLRPQDEYMHFCCSDHRKRYYEYGQMPWGKFHDSIERTVRSTIVEEMNALLRRIERLEKLLDKQRVNVVTLEHSERTV